MSLHLLHLSLYILPIVQHHWLPLPIASASPPPSLWRFAFSFPLHISTEIWKFSLQFFRPLFTPPEAKKERRRGEKNREKCSQWGLEPKLKEWREDGELGVYKTVNKHCRRENKACWHCGASADGPGVQLKHASLACSACASSSLMAKEKWTKD